MSEHVTEWLNAYLDGELRGRRLHHVQQHIAECQSCRAELESLQKISKLLHEVPAPEFPSTEKFTAQLNLRLPRKSSQPIKRKVQEVGWWMIPVSLFFVWVFITTATLVRGVVSTASEVGLLKGAPTWLADGTSSGAIWSDRLGEFGMLSGNSLKWAQEAESFTRNTLPLVIWQVAIALLYVSWIVLWWARRRQGHGRSLEG